MFIYHSIPAPVRVTVVGRFNKQNEELELAVSRCSKHDTFMKRSHRVPAKNKFVAQTKKGPKTIPGHDSYVIKGGVDIAKDRLESGELFAIFPMKKCSAYTFKYIAEEMALRAINNPKLIEISKHGK